MSEWKEYKLGEIADVQTGPFGSQLHQSDYVDVGIPSIMPVNIGDRMNISTEKIVYITEEDAMRLSRYRVQKGDIVYSRRGDVEKCAYINEDEAGWLCGTGCLRIRIDSTQADSKFVAYYLSTEDMKSWISNNAVGTTMPNLNSSILQQVPLSLPSLDKQKQIASILSSLDDKIDLLNRENATLEAMAEALFRQWFIEEAKEDWEEKSLLNCIKLIGGGTPKTSESSYWDGNICWLSGGDIANNHKGFVSATEKSISDEGLNNSSAKLLPENAMVVSARGTVGKYCLLSKPMAFSQSNYGIMPKYDNCFFFTYLLIAYYIDELQSAAYGSVFDTITTKTFEGVDVILPQNKYPIVKFEQMVEPYFSKMKNNTLQVQCLQAQRDILLPKLMSNEISIK